MNVIDIIKYEHRFVDSLFNDWKSVSDLKQKQGIAHNIIKLLSIHGACEEMTIYPFLKTKGDKGTQLVDHALTEHTKMKQDLYELDSMSVDEAGFDSKFAQTVADTVHHVKEEESESGLLVTLSSLASANELAELRKQFIAAKSFAPSRPHPSAPNEPPANKVANAATVPLDAVRDTGRFA